MLFGPSLPDPCANEEIAQPQKKKIDETQALVVEGDYETSSKC